MLGYWFDDFEFLDSEDQPNFCYPENLCDFIDMDFCDFYDFYDFYIDLDDYPEFFEEGQK